MNVKVYKLLKFIGRKGLFWFGINITSGLLLTGTEMAFSLVLIFLMKSLKITAMGSALPFGLDRIEISTKGFLLVLVFFGLLRGLSQVLVSQSAKVANEMIGARLNLLMLYETFKLKTGFLSSSSVNLNVSQYFPRASEFCQNVALNVPVALQALILFIVMVSKAWRETMVGMLGVLVAGIFVHFVNKKVRTISNQMPMEHHLKGVRQNRMIRNFFLLRALRTLQTEYEALLKSNLSLSSMTIRTYFLGSICGVMPQVVGVFIIALILMVQLKAPKLSGEEFLSFLYLFIRFVQSFSTLASNIGGFQVNFPYFRSSVKYFFSFPPDVIGIALEPAAAISPFGTSWKSYHYSSAAKPKSFGGALVQDLPPVVEFNSVSFSYVPNGPLVLNDISFSVAPGDRLAIVGPSGSGKSTLLALTLGLLTPTRGEVKIAGQTPDEYFLKTSHRVGYVGAEPFLIEGSVKENLLYGRQEQFSDAEMWAALSEAQLGEWLRTTSEQLNLKVSENGDGLSTGQKQRLSIARALMSKPSLLILDEISANLDSETENQIAKTIDSLRGCTILIVSHRERLVQQVKQKVFLERKRS